MSPNRVVSARAPTRIDLGGGWTDVPPYCDREGGFVCNVAIDRYAHASVRYGDADPAAPSAGPLVAAALRRAGVTRLRVDMTSDFPVAAGLGGSSAASAALIGALSAWRGLPLDRAAIAEEGRRIEVEDLGVAGGRQDHYAATHGGALALTFDRGVSVRRLAMPAATRDALRRWATLIYTGESRISGETITAVLGAYERGESKVVTALRRMKELARDIATALEAADLHAVAELVEEHWHYQRSLHPGIPTARIDGIIAAAAKAGATGAKAMGASGGGCVLVLSRPACTPAVREAITGLGELLDFGFDEQGVTVTSGSRDA